MGSTPWSGRTSCCCPQSDGGRTRSSLGWSSWQRFLCGFGSVKGNSQWFAALYCSWTFLCCTLWLSAQSEVLYSPLTVMLLLCSKQPRSWADACGILNLRTKAGLTCLSDMYQQLVRSRNGLGSWLWAQVSQTPYFIQIIMGFCLGYNTSTTLMSGIRGQAGRQAGRQWGRVQ